MSCVPLFRTLTMCACLAWVGAVCIEGSQTQVRLTASAQATAVTKPDTTSAHPARELVSKYCVTCHNERVKTAGLLLDRAADQIASDSDTWEKVVVQLRSRAMPPSNMPRPDNATYDAVATWLETELDSRED